MDNTGTNQNDLEQSLRALEQALQEIEQRKQQQLTQEQILQMQLLQQQIMKEFTPDEQAFYQQMKRSEQNWQRIDDKPQAKFDELELAPPGQRINKNDWNALLQADIALQEAAWAKHQIESANAPQLSLDFQAEQQAITSIVTQNSTQVAEPTLEQKTPEQQELSNRLLSEFDQQRNQNAPQINNEFSQVSFIVYGDPSDKDRLEQSNLLNSANMHGFKVNFNEQAIGDIPEGMIATMSMQGRHSDERMTAFLETTLTHANQEQHLAHLTTNSKELRNGFDNFYNDHRDKEGNLNKDQLNQSLDEIKKQGNWSSSISFEDQQWLNRMQTVEIKIEQPMFDQVDFIMANDLNRNSNWEAVHMGNGDTGQGLHGSRFAYEGEIYTIGFAAGNKEGDAVFSITNDRNDAVLGTFSVDKEGQLSSLNTINAPELNRDLQAYLSDKVNNFSERDHSDKRPDHVESTLKDKEKESFSNSIEKMGTVERAPFSYEVDKVKSLEKEVDNKGRDRDDDDGRDR